MTAHTSARVVIFILCLSGYCLAYRKLLIFLIDGFRYDYIDDLEVHPGFREIVENGVKVDYMTPDFPSLSFPNYYSLMTGRNSEVHHITGNYMWDQATLKEFKLGTNNDSHLRMWWDGSEPLWVTMQKLQRNVYMYYWPGCDVDILGIRPAHCQEYVYYPSEKNFTDAIEDSLNALSCGNADMAAVYYETVDVMGHHYGPSSLQIKETINGLDNTFQILNQRIKEKSLQDDLNVIIFSDHGMTDIQWMDKVIELQQYINMSDVVKMMDRGPVVSLWPKQSKLELIYRRLSAVENMKVYKRDEIPDRYYYKKGKFVSTLTLVADLGWFITESKAMLPFWKNGTGEPQGWQSGWHGYDNELVDMRGFFLARGPDFKKNLRAGPIRAVDVYNLMCHTLGIQALPNNGSWARVEFMLNPEHSGGRRSGGGQPTLTFSFFLGLLLLVLLNGL